MPPHDARAPVVVTTPRARKWRSGRARAWDATVTILLLLCMVALTVEASTLGGLVGFAEAECEPACVQPAIDVGVGIAVIGPLVVAVAVVIVTIVRLVRRRPGWWLPLVGALALPVPIVLGGLVAHVLSGA